MRTISALLMTTAVLFSDATTTAADQRSDAGESPQEMALKNRKAVPKDSDFDHAVSLQALLDKQDRNAWSNTRAAILRGVVVQTEKEQDGDIHIVLAPSGKETDTRQWVIAEVPVAAQKRDATLRFDVIQALKGKQVNVSGWLYYEPDTEQDDPRGTLWELHPATAVTLARE
ncbi:MAG: hypothetical protein ABI411_20175 [Tahibacter sp.]